MPETHEGPALVLLQLSDPHLFAEAGVELQGVDTEQGLLRVLGQALDNHPEAAAILLTGDLAHDESAGAYRRLAAHLATARRPVHLLPGNHDDNRLLHDIADERLLTGQVFDYGNWRVVLLNSQLPGRAGGHLDEAELDLLQGALAEAPHRFALVCLHHNVVDTGSAWLDTMTLDNADALFAVLDRHPQVRAVSWGHVHQEQQACRNDVVLLGCPATCFQFKPNSQDFALDAIEPGYRWLHLHADGRIETGITRVALKNA